MKKIGSVGKFRRTFEAKDIKVVYKGFLKLLTFLDDNKKRKEMLHRGDSVFVLPIDWQAHEVVMISEPRINRIFGERRMGRDIVQEVLAAPPGGYYSIGNVEAKDVVSMEMIAGTINPDETPEAAAIRETAEESGYAIAEKDLTKIDAVYATIGGSDEVLHLYFADIGQAAHTPPQGDGDEQIEVYRVEFKEAFEMLEARQCKTVASAILLRQLQLEISF